jgi:hypothetical protein
MISGQDSLGKLNHYCFGGRQNFGNGFRVLVAGGGTSDHTIVLAEPPCCRFMYDPTACITDPALKSHVAKLPRPQQQAIAEAMNCVLTCHGFYAAPEPGGTQRLL